MPSLIDSAPSFAIASRGSTPFGQRSLQKKQRVHSQMPCSPLYVLEPLDRRRVARVADEAHALRERLRPEKLRVRLHRVALRDAAAAVDAERLLVDDVHPLLRDAVLAAVLRALVAGLQVRLDRLELVPERLHVDDEVLHDRQVPHRRDHRHAALLRDVVHARLAREHSRPVHAHAARAADHHPAALPVRERAVVLVLDDVEAVEERRLFRRVDLVLPQRALARGRVVPPDLQSHLHQYFLSSGSHFVTRTGAVESSTPSSFQRVIEWCMKFSSSRVG